MPSKLFNEYGVLDWSSETGKIIRNIGSITNDHINKLINDGISITDIKALEYDFLTEIAATFSEAIILAAIKLRKEKKDQLNARDSNFDI